MFSHPLPLFGNEVRCVVRLVLIPLLGRHDYFVGLGFNHAPHQLNVLLAMIWCLQQLIRCMSMKLFVEPLCVTKVTG